MIIPAKSQFNLQITIKDLPYELTDQFLATHLAKFGQVVDGSIKRGYIRETTIENGTRYAQLLNCIPLIPNRTSFGNVRIFADNNRTSCTYCGRTDHPSRYNCNERGHIVKQCKQSTICNYCKKKEGHIRSTCDQYKMDQMRQDYGDYTVDIIEGLFHDQKHRGPEVRGVSNPETPYTEVYN